MTRKLETNTLSNAAQYYAAQFMLDRGITNRDWVIGQFHNFTFRDEFGALCKLMADHLGKKALSDFNSAISRLAKEKPRTDKVFEKLLADKLAIDPDGNHIAGKIGTTQHGNRVVGRRIKVIQLKKSKIGIEKNIYWPVYAGEGLERQADSGVADPLPEGAEPMSVGALNTRHSNECILLGLDAIVDNYDEGTGAAVLEGRSGAQPADPDTAVTGTLLFTLVYSATSFGAAADDTGKGTATAAAITDDTSADATNTVGYCRLSSTNDSITPLDDHNDGEAGTAGADFNFNTTAIVAGANVSMTAHTVSLNE